MAQAVKRHSDYLLSVGEKGAERLNVLNEVYNPASHRFIRKAGLKKGARVLELGCGTGEMASWMAQFVGDEGHVVAVDANLEQIGLGEEKKRMSCLENLSFRHLCAHDLGCLQETFDFIYFRFVLAHVNRPQAVLKDLYKLLKPGGVLAGEESSISASFSFHKNRHFDAWRRIWMGLKTRNGLPRNMGVHLPKLVKKAGFSKVDMDIFQPVLSTPREKSILRKNIEECAEKIEEHGLVPHGKFNDLIDGLKSFEESDDMHVGFVKNIQVCAQKEG